MFVDSARFTVRSGNGGNGAVSMYRGKYQPHGGPDGGDGGRGGSIYFVVKENVSTLADYRINKSMEAIRGEHGKGAQMNGKKGDDLYLPVPPGTLLYNDETGELICELTHPEQCMRLLPGGRGGYGNKHFCRSTYQSPRFAEMGDTGKEMAVRLELSLIADFAIIGVPSVGKSSLISIVSGAKPKIADYPFTTTTPNLGVVKHKGSEFVLVDVPGLIEGASEGKGLWDDFLKHIQRTRALIHMLDASLESADKIVEQYNMIRNELLAYDQELFNRPQIILLSKVDMLMPSKKENLVTELSQTLSQDILPISTYSHENKESLLDMLVEMSKSLPKHDPYDAESLVHSQIEEDTPIMELEYDIYRGVDPKSISLQEEPDGSFRIFGPRIEEIARMTNPENEEALLRLGDILLKKDIDIMLHQMGAKLGDTIKIANIEFDLSVPPRKNKKEKTRV